MEVLTCNTIRRIMNGKLVANQFVKNVVTNNLAINFLVKTCHDICLKITDYHQTYLKEFLMFVANLFIHKINLSDIAVIKYLCRYLSMVLPQISAIRNIILNEPLKKFVNGNELKLLSSSLNPPHLINNCSFSCLDPCEHYLSNS